MCVYVKNAKNGLGTARPEWPDVAAATGELIANGDLAQSFPDTSRTEVVSSGTSGTSGTASGTEVVETGTPGALRDPWQAPDEAEPEADPAHDPAHDPHEVTVQLDDVGSQVEDLLVRQAKGAKTGKGSPDASDGPVFVDESGRRSRRYRRIGITVALACGVYAVVIVVTLLSGNSNAPWLPVPGQNADQPAGEVDTTDGPADSAGSSGDGTGTGTGTGPGTGAAPPGTVPTAADGSTPTAKGTGSAAPGASAGPGKPGTSAGPSPTATSTTPGPGTGAVDPSTSPTPTQNSPSPEPSTSTGGGSTSPDPSASAGPTPNGASDPSPLAEGPVAEGPAGEATPSTTERAL